MALLVFQPSPFTGGKNTHGIYHGIQAMKRGIVFFLVNLHVPLMAHALFAIGFLLTYQAVAVAQTAGSTTDSGAFANSARSAVVFMYHRFGEDRLPSTNIRIDQFESHIAELSSGGYHVLPLPEILSALREGRGLPDRTVGITIDDGFRSVYTKAFPRLREAGFPFTVFIATDGIDSGNKNLISWDQVRELAAQGVTIGAHTASHLHMVDSTTSKNREDIVRSNARFHEELGYTPRLFAYPYGESGLAAAAMAEAAGYEAAFGQHSGVVYPGSDFFNLPRFALNEKYGTPERFRQVADALPLPVTDLLPADMVLNTDLPAVGFTVDEGIRHLNRLACFPSSGPQAMVEHLGGRRIEVRFVNPLPQGRSRLNCTLPGPEERWRWLGMMFYRLPANNFPRKNAPPENGGRFQRSEL